MQSNTSSGNIKDALRRLIDGIRRTFTIFHVYNDVDIERGNVEQNGSAERKHPMDEKNLEKKQLYAYDYEENLKILPAKIFTPRNFNQSGCSGIPHNHKVKKKITTKHPQKITFFIEGGESLILPLGKRGNKDITFYPTFTNDGLFPPLRAEKRKSQREDAMKPFKVSKRQKQRSDSPGHKKSKRRKVGDGTSPSEVFVVLDQKMQPIGQKKSEGCCGQCCKQMLSCLCGKKVRTKKPPKYSKNGEAKHKAKEKKTTTQTSKSLLELPNDNKRASKQGSETGTRKPISAPEKRDKGTSTCHNKKCETKGLEDFQRCNKKLEKTTPEKATKAKIKNKAGYHAIPQTSEMESDLPEKYGGKRRRKIKRSGTEERPRLQRKNYREVLNWFYDKRPKRKLRARKKIKKCKSSTCKDVDDVERESLPIKESKNDSKRKTRKEEEIARKTVPDTRKLLDVEYFNKEDPIKPQKGKALKPVESDREIKSPRKTEQIQQKGSVQSTEGKKGSTGLRKGRSTKDLKLKNSDTGSKYSGKSAGSSCCSMDLAEKTEKSNRGIKSPRKGDPLQQKESVQSTEERKRRTRPTGRSTDTLIIQGSDTGSIHSRKSTGSACCSTGQAGKPIPPKPSFQDLNSGRNSPTGSKNKKLIESLEYPKACCCKNKALCKLVTVGGKTVCTDRATLKQVDDWNDKKKPSRASSSTAKNDGAKQGTSKLENDLPETRLGKWWKKRKGPKPEKRSRAQLPKEKYRELLNWFLDKRKKRRLKARQRRKPKLGFGKECTPSSCGWLVNAVEGASLTIKESKNKKDIPRKTVPKLEKASKLEESDRRITSPREGKLREASELDALDTGNMYCKECEPIKPIPPQARRSTSSIKEQSRKASKPEQSITGKNNSRKRQTTKSNIRSSWFPMGQVASPIPPKQSRLDPNTKSNTLTGSKKGRSREALKPEKSDTGSTYSRKNQSKSHIGSSWFPMNQTGKVIPPKQSARDLKTRSNTSTGLRKGRPPDASEPEDCCSKSQARKPFQKSSSGSIESPKDSCCKNKTICPRTPKTVSTDQATLKTVGDQNKLKKSESNVSLQSSLASKKVPKNQITTKILDLENLGSPVNADFVIIFLLNYEEQLGELLEGFLQTIQAEGILFERVISVDHLDTLFIKVQIPSNVAIDLAKIYDIKLACTNPYFEYEAKAWCSCRNTELTSVNSSGSMINRNGSFIRGDKPKEPTSSEKTRVLYELLKVTKFSDEVDDFGIWELKRKRVIADAYPLHDGPVKWNLKGPLNERQLLGRYWTAIQQFFTIQPIQHVERYFGPEVAYYFAFMEWYITMLIPAAIFGLIPIFYGFATMRSNTFVNLYCNKDMRNKIVCAICESPKICGYSLFDSCFNFKITYLFDNACTKWFGIFTSIWGLVFMALWIRQQNSLKVSWNLHGRIEMDLFVRPAYLKRVGILNISPITGEPEPHVTKTKEVLTRICVLEGMLLAIFVVLLVFFLLILYRIQLTAELTADNKVTNSDGVEVQRRSPAVRSAAFRISILSSVIIIMFSHLFDFVAIFLTDLENPRTQGEYDQSHILKLVLFSCINHYHMIIYLALFRSMKYTHPGDVKMWRWFYGINADICDTSGCLIDVVYYITTLLIVKTIANYIQQLIIPMVFKNDLSNRNRNRAQWEQDYHLLPTSPYYFSKLNVDLVTQYGLVIFFMPAFPLLPLLALIVNLIDTRVNAKGLLELRRRPIARQICERELWNQILLVMTFIGIIIHGCIFTFLANWVERATFEGNKNLGSNLTYLDATFTSFSTSSYRSNNSSVESCLFSAKQSSSPPFHRTLFYFQVLGNRLSVIGILLGLVICGGVIFLSIIPTVSYPTQEKINYLESKQIF